MTFSDATIWPTTAGSMCQEMRSTREFQENPAASGWLSKRAFAIKIMRKERWVIHCITDDLWQVHSQLANPCMMLWIIQSMLNDYNICLMDTIQSVRRQPSRSSYSVNFLGEGGKLDWALD